MHLPLTVLVATINGEEKLAKILPQLREIADDLVIGIDTTTTDGTRETAEKFADTVFDLPHESFLPDGTDDFEGPLEHSLPHCKGEWVLRVDHDETLSSGWSSRDRVQELLSDRRVTNYQVIRRWAIPPGDRFISTGQWFPDYSTRLFRNLPSLLRGPRAVHDDIFMLGETRWLTREWVVHWDLVWHSRETREAKVKVFEQLGPWSGAEHYLFEGQAYDTLPLDYEPPPLPERDPALVVGDDPLGCWMEALEVPTTMVAGAKHFVLISVRNLSPRTFRPGIRGRRNGNVLASHHWLDASGAPVQPWDQVRMELPTCLKPGEAAAMYLPVLAVPPPGRYWLQLDLVEEGVGWAGDRRRLPAYPIVVVSPK
jgi:hypothetical protein